MNTASGNGRLDVHNARRGGRGASGRLFLAAALPFVLACGGAEGASTADLKIVSRLEAGDSLGALVRPAAYAGVFACEKCVAEPSVLVLAPDGTYRLLSPIRALEGSERLLSLGRWVLSRDSVPVLSLRGEGEERRFAVLSALRLRPLGANDEVSAATEESLSPREAARATRGEFLRVSVPPIRDGRLAVKGEFRDESGGASFVSCDAGSRFAVRGGDALLRLQRQHAEHPLGDGAATRVVLFGRLETESGAPEAAVVDSFVPMPAREECEAMRVRAFIAVGDWQATALDGVDLAELPVAARPSLRFVLSEPTMFGHATCHRFTGPAVLRGLDLAPGSLKLTDRACADTTAMARDARYSQILSAGGWFRLEGTELVLSHGGTEMVRYRRR